MDLNEIAFNASQIAEWHGPESKIWIVQPWQEWLQKNGVEVKFFCEVKRMVDSYGALLQQPSQFAYVQLKSAKSEALMAAAGFHHDRYNCGRGIIGGFGAYHPQHFPGLFYAVGTLCSIVGVATLDFTLADAQLMRVGQFMPSEARELPPHSSGKSAYTIHHFEFVIPDAWNFYKSPKVFKSDGNTSSPFLHPHPEGLTTEPRLHFAGSDKLMKWAKSVALHYKLIPPTEEGTK